MILKMPEETTTSKSKTARTKTAVETVMEVVLFVRSNKSVIEGMTRMQAHALCQSHVGEGKKLTMRCVDQACTQLGVTLANRRPGRAPNIKQRQTRIIAGVLRRLMMSLKADGFTVSDTDLDILTAINGGQPMERVDQLTLRLSEGEDADA